MMARERKEREREKEKEKEARSKSGVRIGETRMSTSGGIDPHGHLSVLPLRFLVFQCHHYTFFKAGNSHTLYARAKDASTMGPRASIWISDSADQRAKRLAEQHDARGQTQRVLPQDRAFGLHFCPARSPGRHGHCWRGHSAVCTREATRPTTGLKLREPTATRQAIE